MDDKIKVSVLMCVYNPDAGYLSEAVSSIIGQTLGEWELLLYDDGCSPAGAGLLQKEAGRDPRIRYLRGDENCGLGHALNECLKERCGKYIARMDADDVSKPERLERQYGFLETHGEYQWAGTNAELMDGGGIWGRRRMPEVPDRRDFLRFSPYIHPSVMFRREALEHADGYRELLRNEDYELFMRLHAQGYRGYNLQEELFVYREDAEAYRRRAGRFRVEEMKVRSEGFRRLGLPAFLAAPYVLKPLLTVICPDRLLRFVKERVRRERYVEGYKRRKA